MCGAIVLHDHWMVNGNIIGTLFEIGHWIPTSLHQFAYQLISSGNRALRTIHKLRLHRTPPRGEVGVSSGGEGTKFKFIPAFGANLEYAFGTTNLAFPFENAVVFRTKAFT